MQKMRIYIHDHMNSFRTILLGFCLLILGGAVLLSMPFASASGEPVPFINALFTSVSASCVTGLVVYDTAVQWSLAGRTIILMEISSRYCGYTDYPGAVDTQIIQVLWIHRL